MSKTKLIKESLARLKAINITVQTEGGQLLIKTFRKDILNSLDKLAYNYHNYSHAELVSECANLRSRLDVLRAFMSAKKNEIIAENDLAEAMEEDPEL